MNECSTLPVTGASHSLALVAATLVTMGALLVVAVRWRRHSVLPAVVVLAVGLAPLAGAGQRAAATPCPPTTGVADAGVLTSSTSAPVMHPEPSTTTAASTATTALTSSTSVSVSTSTTSTSTTSTTLSTLPLIAPIAVNDEGTFNGGTVTDKLFTFNLFANDSLGQPPATLEFILTGVPIRRCSAISVDRVSGDVTFQAPLGFCNGTYRIGNEASTSDATFQFNRVPA